MLYCTASHGTETIAKRAPFLAVELKVSGFVGAVNQKCPNVFQAHQSVANFRAEIFKDLRETNCVGVEFKIGGLVAAARGKCPQSLMFA